MSRLDSFRRIQWGCRAALALGIVASLTANVLHAEPTVVGRAVAAWPPIALVVTIEIMVRVPAGGRRALTVLRWLGAIPVAGIAAWASYWHMTGVAASVGEDPITARLLPGSVDGLILVASVSLVVMAHQIRGEQDAAELLTAPWPDWPEPADSTPDTPPAQPAPSAERPPGDVAPPGDDALEDGVVPDPDPLLDVARTLTRQEPATSWPALAGLLRQAGHSLSNDRARTIHAALRAERSGQLSGQVPS